MSGKTMRAKKRGAAGWCEKHGVGPGDHVEVRIYTGEWIRVRLTALGECAVMLRRKGCMEFALNDVNKMRLVLAQSSANVPG